MQKRFELKKEIILLLSVKLLLIYLIWFFCFSHPVDERTMPANTAQHIFNFSPSKNYD